MQGNIDFSGTLSGSIAGGGGGSEVTITPTLQSGTKIADYTIDETSGSLYAPSSLIETVSSPLVLVGKDLRVDLSNYYTKAEMQIELQTYQRSIQSIDDQLIISGTFNNQLSLSFDIDNYQEKLTAGSNITIDPVTNVISVSGVSGISYSLTEQDTGLTWVDASHIYQRTYELDNITIPANGVDISSYIDNINNINLIISANAKSLTYRSSCNIWCGFVSSVLKAYCAEATQADYITLQYTKSV